MLTPNNRSIYTTDIFPPRGMRLDRALATTFTLDPQLLLGIPLCLSGLETSTKVVRADRVAVWEMLQRYEDRIRVFVQSGGIGAPRVRNAYLFSFLEKVVVQRHGNGNGNGVRGREGAFHPKIWVLRYESPEDKREVTYRLLILSRNMAASNAWDFSLRVDSATEKNKKIANKNDFNVPLCDFLDHLLKEESAKENEPKKNATLADAWKQFVKELRNVDWELPPECMGMKFHHHGYDGKHVWQVNGIPQGSRLLIVSPFCTPEAIDQLGKRSGKADDNPILVSMPMELDKLASTLNGEKALAHFAGNTFQLNDDYTPPPPEEDDDSDASKNSDRNDGVKIEECRNDPDTVVSGLHAKIYLYESGENAHLVMGSANATDPALLPKTDGKTSNVEILVDMTFKKKPEDAKKWFDRYGGFGKLLNSYKPVPKEETEQEKAEKDLERARDRIVQAFRDVCIRCEAVEESGPWKLVFPDEPTIPLQISDGVKMLRIRPLTSSNVKSLAPAEWQSPILLGPFPAKELSGLIVFELISEIADLSPQSFVLNLKVDDLPLDVRRREIQAEVIENWSDFLKYVVLLFNETNYVSEISFGDSKETGGSGTTWSGVFGELPVLETLVRNFCADPKMLESRLNSLDAVVDNMLKKDTDRLITGLDKSDFHKGKVEEMMLSAKKLKDLCRIFREALPD